jgi:hypothetical protein
MATIHVELGIKNHCAGEGQQQFSSQWKPAEWEFVVEWWCDAATEELASSVFYAARVEVI